MYERFEQLCQKKGVTPYKVSKETGVSQTTLSSWKTRNSTPNLETAMKIAKYFGVPVGYLVDDGATAEYSDIEIWYPPEDKTFMYTRAEAVHGMLAQATKNEERKLIDLLYAISRTTYSDERLKLLFGYVELLSDDQRDFIDSIIERELQRNDQ